MIAAELLPLSSAPAKLACLRAVRAQRWVLSVLLYAGGTFPLTWQGVGLWAFIYRLFFSNLF